MPYPVLYRPVYHKYPYRLHQEVDDENKQDIFYKNLAHVQDNKRSALYNAGVCVYYIFSEKNMNKLVKL